MIIHQADRAVIDLFKKVWKVYNFMNKVGRLAEIPSMQALHGKIAQQTLGCADFIYYTKMRNLSGFHHAIACTQSLYTGGRLSRDVFEKNECHNSALR